MDVHRRRDTAGLVLPTARGGRTDTAALGCADSDSDADTYGYAIAQTNPCTDANPDGAAHTAPNANTDR